MLSPAHLLPCRVMLADLKHDLEDAQRSLDAACKEADLRAAQIEENKIELKVLHRAASAKRTQVVEVRGAHSWGAYGTAGTHCVASIHDAHGHDGGEGLMLAKSFRQHWQGFAGLAGSLQHCPARTTCGWKEGPAPRSQDKDLLVRESGPSL